MTEIVRNIYLLSKIVRIDSVNNLKLRSHIYHHNIRNTTLHTIFHVLFLFICLNFSNKSKIKCATNAAAISGGMSHTMFPVIFVSILLYNLQKMFFSTFQQISMSNSHRTSCEFLKDIFGRISGANSGARWSPSRIQVPVHGWRRYRSLHWVSSVSVQVYCELLARVPVTTTPAPLFEYLTPRGKAL